MVKGNAEIRIIQGDSYQKNVIIENVEPSLIVAVYFSSNKLNVCKQLDYDSENNKYKLFLTRQETALFEKGVYDYDITIKFERDVVRTIPYRTSLTILPKVNKVGCID